MVPPGRAATLHLPSPAAHLLLLPAAQPFLPFNPPFCPRHRPAAAGAGQHRRPSGGRRCHLLRRSQLLHCSHLLAGRLPTCCFLVRPTPARRCTLPKGEQADLRRCCCSSFRQGAALFRVRFLGSSSSGAPALFWLSDGQCRASTLPLTAGRRSGAHECLAKEAVCHRFCERRVFPFFFHLLTNRPLPM